MVDGSFRDFDLLQGTPGIGSAAAGLRAILAICAVRVREGAADLFS